MAENSSKLARRARRSTAGALIVIAVITAGFAGFGAGLDGFFQQVRSGVTDYVGWFMIFVMNAALMLVVWLSMGRHRDQRIGGAQAEPQFSLAAWLSMLFAAGMGIGLLFYAVAEPLAHFERMHERPGPEAAAEAMNLTFLHWGLHPWAIYALVGLTLAWFHFNRDQPLSFAGPLTLIAPDKVGRPLGNVVNLLAVLGAVFGVSTSLGLGAAQAGEGIKHLTGLDNGLTLQLSLVVLVSTAAAVSVASGVTRGVKLVSSANLLAAIGLMFFVLFAGETLLALKAMGHHMGHYFGHFVETSTWREVYGESGWQADWTLFYWAWWISWSPFVGVFIARISYGRSIRTFVLGVLVAPSLFNFFWMTVFGSNALNHELTGPGFGDPDAAAALFGLLDLMPLGAAAIGLATVIVLLFFVTSADSGALVTATLANAGVEPGWRPKTAWALTIMAVTASLMTAGGLDALQSATILTGAPFALVLVACGVALVRAVGREARALKAGPN